MQLALSSSDVPRFAAIVTLGLCLSLYALPTFAESIEMVDSYSPLPRPAVTFQERSDGGGILVNVTPREPLPDGVTVEVIATTGQGVEPPLRRLDATTYQLDIPRNSFAFVTVKSGDAVGTPSSKPRIMAGVTSVYWGDLAEALDKLRVRFEKLPAASAEDSLAAIHQRDLREWLSHRLSSIELTDEERNSELVTGPTVSDLLYAEELLRMLEGSNDVLFEAQQRQLPARRVFNVTDGKELHQTGFDFLLRLPEQPAEEKWPLLVIVHGSTQNPNIEGGRRDEIEEAAAQMDFPFMTVAPIVNREMRRGGWNPGELAAFVESLIEDYPIDPSRVYLSGFSAGGYATVSTVLRRPDLFAAYAPLCGSGDPAWAPILAAIPAQFYHGSTDPTITTYSSLNFVRALEANGGEPSLRVYLGMGHPVWVEVYRDPEFYKRLLKHQRVPRINTPANLQEAAAQGDRLELFESAPLSLQVCWAERSLKVGDLIGRQSSLREVRRDLELLYPEVPLTGPVLLRCPEGWQDESSSVTVGIAVAEETDVPQGYVLKPLKTSGELAATYHGEFEVPNVAEAAERFQILRESEQPSAGKGLLIELEGSGRRFAGNSRMTIRGISESPPDVD